MAANLCTHSEVDITIVFGTIIPSSSLGGCTKQTKKRKVKSAFLFFVSIKFNLELNDVCLCMILIYNNIFDFRCAKFILGLT